MHYKNGREAKNGDKVVLLPTYPKDATGKISGVPRVGILYNATPGNDTCNGNLAIITGNDPCPNLSECLHLDDVNAVLHPIAEVPDSSAVEKVFYTGG